MLVVTAAQDGTQYKRQHLYRHSYVPVNTNAYNTETIDTTETIDRRKVQ